MIRIVGRTNQRSNLYFISVLVTIDDIMLSGLHRRDENSDSFVKKTHKKYSV